MKDSWKNSRLVYRPLKVCKKSMFRMDGWTAWWTDGRMDGWMDVIHLDTGSTLVLVNRYICREKKVFIFFLFCILSQWRVKYFSAGANTFKSTEIKDMRIFFCFRKSEVSVERISRCYVKENLAEYGIHCPPCSFSNDVIYRILLQLWRHSVV